MEKGPLFFEHEQEPTLDELFNQLVDTKFLEGEVKPSPLARDHEEALQLLITHRLALCPTATSMHLIRPILAERELAMQKWPHYGGVRAFVIEVNMAGSSIETDFFVIENTMYARRTHIVPFESVTADPQPIDHTYAEDVFRCINTAIPYL